ncbi:MAG: isochorismatase family protein [Acidobacteria bacterium]|nr:isochorismatase family protein [Acidobacteriota bacterium]
MTRLDRNDAILAVIDVQERLMAVIHDAREVETNVVRLVRGCHILGVPVVVTEQYPRGIGPTTEAIRAAMFDTGTGEPFQKMCFSGLGSDELASALRHSKRHQVILCGVESHVCVFQTCRDLLVNDYEVFIAADATSSRTLRNRELALRRMTDDGARLTTTEMALFEMTAVSGTDEFRAISTLVK